jgi:hypothetical protein
MTDDATMTTCDNCTREISEDQYDDHDGLCAECLAGTFTCEECGERTFQTDAHGLLKTMCESCGDQELEERRQERLDKAAEELRDLTEAIIDLDDFGTIRKAVAVLKRLLPKSLLTADPPAAG